MTDPGKKFETDFRKSAPKDALVIRLKNRMSQYRGDGEIADFLVYSHPNLFVFELKSTKEKRLPFAMIRLNQIMGIEDAVTYEGVYGGIIVQFRDPHSHWYVPIKVLKEYIEAGKKSIPLAEMESNKEIIPIQFTIKRVSCILNVEDLLKTIKEVNDANNTSRGT
jgi:penicillin-binding protein-related factor A (putative recombinase)